MKTDWRIPVDFPDINEHEIHIWKADLRTSKFFDAQIGAVITLPSNIIRIELVGSRIEGAAMMGKISTGSPEVMNIDADFREITHHPRIGNGRY